MQKNTRNFLKSKILLSPISMFQVSVEFVVTDRPPDQQFDIQALRRFDLEKPDILYSLSQLTVITHNKAFLWNLLMLDQIWTYVGYVQVIFFVRAKPKFLG